MDGALATVPVPAGPDAGLELTDEQTATLALLKKIRDQAGEYEERFAKVALVKAQRQSERDLALAERNALQTELEKLQKHSEALQQRKGKLTARTLAVQQQTVAMERDTAALDHAIKTLHGKMRQKKREIEVLQQRRHAELAGERKYLKAQRDLQDKYSEQGARLQLQEHEACVKQQIKEAEAERKEADQEYSTYMSTKFGARGVPVEIGIASKELFEDNTLSLSDLAERLAKAQQ